jgi:uncharacterized protein YndB with AHSA1/START domain
MPLQSSEPRPATTTPFALDDGPILECAPHGTDGVDQLLRIRAQRRYSTRRDDLFATWTRRTAWDSWMRLRARSRATLSAYPGGSFRLELAEGPTIHVVTGTLIDVRPPEFLSLSWVHNTTHDQGSTVDVTFREHLDQTELTLVHRSITSRREASWLMRLWGSFLGRLGDYVEAGQPSSLRRVRDIARRISETRESPPQRRIGGSFARSAALAFALVTAPAVRSPAQLAPDSAQAASYYLAAKWNEAAQAYGALTRKDTSVMNWYRYGVALDELGRHGDAVVALRHALRAGPPFANQVRYRIAKAHAGAHARDSVIAELDSAAAGGFRLWEAVRDDADFAPIRSDAAFTRVLARLENNRFPCRQTPENRQLDYWVGNWRVVNGATLLGTNTVELVNGDCMVQENWMSAGSGGGGKSWSYYDPSIRKWRQVFIFDSGGVWEFTGGLHDGAMQFERSIPATSSAPASVQRMTYFLIAKDSVRQYIESTTDGGKTWTPGFDGMYVRKPAGTR